MLNKNYWPFFICTGLFLMIIFYSIVVYAGWNRPAENGLSVEVNLPVLDLEKYSSLSKQLEGVNVGDSS